VDLELIAGLGVEARLGVQAVDVGVDVHDEHRAARTGKHIQIVEVQLAGLSGQRRVEMMRHEQVLMSLREPAVWQTPGVVAAGR
jgi:hypothetical protein